MNAAQRHTNGPLYALTAAAVVVQLAGAAVLKLAVDCAELGWGLAGVLLAVHFVLQAGRFTLTWQVHRRYPVARSYPLSALFLPAVVVLAAATGEPVDLRRMLAVAIVVAGIFVAASAPARDGHPQDAG